MLRRKSAGVLRVRDVDFEVKAAGDGYRLKGHGSVFGVVDSYREVVLEGAFKESLGDLARKGRKLPMLWQHRSGEPLGVWDRLEEDAKGLYLEGDLVKGVARAEEAQKLIAAGAVSGLSIGYWVREDSTDQKERITYLKRLDLVETSVVTFPANDEARLEGLKFLFANGGLPAIRDFELFLRREAGLSKTQAALVVTKGFAELHRRESGADGDTEGLSKAMDDLKGIAAQFEGPLFT